MDDSMIERVEQTKGLPMTVAQLRAYLADFPDDAPVLVNGYEGDFTLAQKPTLGRYGPSSADDVEWYYGDWVEASDEPRAIRDCILIEGERARWPQ